MRFFSGFSLTNERHYFDALISPSEYSVAGFSYGAIKAAHYVAQSHERIDTLQLFSPAFFQTKKESFKRLQLGGYLKNPDRYLETFLENCFAPCGVQSVERGAHSEEALRELLYYEWSEELLRTIVSKGTRIDVYLGLEDRIVDVEGAKAFFLPYATVTSIRRANHFLQECL